MTWKDSLRPGSFRGVAFHTEDRSAKTGRRIALHEYPKRDSPFPEDMGKDTRKFSVKVYLVGEDYMSARERLMQACEQAGPGRFVDYWRGEIQVVCEACDLQEHNHQGRYCTFSLSFIEAGEDLGIAGLAATAVQLGLAASSLAATAAQAFALGSGSGLGSVSSFATLTGSLGQLADVAQGSGLRALNGFAGNLPVTTALGPALAAAKSLGRSVADLFEE